MLGTAIHYYSGRTLLILFINQNPARNQPICAFLLLPATLQLPTWKTQTLYHLNESLRRDGQLLTLLRDWMGWDEWKDFRALFDGPSYYIVSVYISPNKHLVTYYLRHTVTINTFARLQTNNTLLTQASHPNSLALHQVQTLLVVIIAGPHYIDPSKRQKPYQVRTNLHMN